jgi:hypothetical protein
MLLFLKTLPNTVKLLLKHIACSSISDLILKLISIEDAQEGTGTIKWLASEGVIPHLFELLNPTLTPEIHSNAAQTLMDIISISFQQQPTESIGSASAEDPNYLSSHVGNELMDGMKRYC